MSRRPPRRFGLWTLTFLVVANMIGAGVFTTSGFTLAALGTPDRVIAAWVVGGVIAICGAASYGVLVRAMPESGGEYLFLSRAAHPLLGFVAGWVSLIAGFTGAIALAASAFESYVAPSFMPPDSTAIALVILAGLLHGVGPRAGAYLQNSTVALKLLLLTAFVVLAFTGTYAEPPDASPEAPFEFGSFAASLAWISLSYSGFNAAVYVAGESTRRHIPRALVLGTLITTALYLALNWIFVHGPPPASISGKTDVAAIAAESIGGPGLAVFVRAVIALALATSVSSLLMAGPRIYAKMADDGLLPLAFRFQNGKPGIAITAQVLAAILIIRISRIEDLIAYLGVTLSVCGALTVGCLFLPSLRRPWPALVAPAIYIAATLVAATFFLIADPVQGWATLATFSVGAGVYWLSPSRTAPGNTISSGDSQE